MPGAEDISTLEVEIPPHGLGGLLSVPPRATGLVVFVHGSGSSRFSPRNTLVARALSQAGFATLLFDLLTPREAQNRANVFDISLLASRLAEAEAWVAARKDVSVLPLGYFGASTGAAAALVDAARPEAKVRAVVSRGGRPDLAGPALTAVRAPTLLIVGGADREVLELNRAAQSRLRCETSLEIVPRAGHLFEEPGTLEQVVDLAEAWFQSHFVS
jgi:putative phosphoribosyl transferase